MINRNNVADEDVQRVVDGFKHYMQHAIETNDFSVAELKNFMEPIFERAGFRSTQGGGSKTHILVLHEAAAGDFVVMSSAIREIRRLYPNAYITLVVEKCAASLAECCPYIDELIVESFKSNDTFLQDFDYDAQSVYTSYSIHLNVAEKLLRRRFDLAFAIVYGVYPTLSLSAYMSGARERISHFGGMWSPLLTVNVEHFQGSHVTDVALAYIETLIKTPVANRKLEAWFSPFDLGQVQSMLPTCNALYAIGLGGSAPKRHYPPESYAALMNMIIRENDGVHFVLLGGKTEQSEASLIMSSVEPNRVTDLTGRISFRQTTATLSLCDMFIGNDTGTRHLASATDTPVLSPNCFPLELPRPVSLNMWYPYEIPAVMVCPRHALDDCKNSTDHFGCAAAHPHCITQIAPLDMFRGYKLLLERIAKGINKPLFIGCK